MFTYEQTTGRMTRNANFVGRGYSGADEGKNNSAWQQVHNKGPIPQGGWTIKNLVYETPLHGPYVIMLQAKDWTNVFGRSGFLIHGDSRVHPGTASHGCIVLARNIREQIWNSGDRDLEVIV